MCIRLIMRYSLKWEFILNCDIFKKNDLCERFNIVFSVVQGFLKPKEQNLFKILK